MAFYNTGARYLFSLAREGVLPAGLGRGTPTQRGPVNASMTVSVLAGLYMLAFVLSDSSTLAALLKLGTWTPLLGVLGILAVQGLCCVAIVRFFLDPGARRLPRDQDAARAGHRVPCHGRRALPADRQPRGPLRRRRGALHQARPVRGAGDLRRRHGRRAVAAQPVGRALPGDRPAFVREEDVEVAEAMFRLRATDRRLSSGSRPQPDRGARGRRPRHRPDSARSGDYRAADGERVLRPSPRRATTSSRSRSPSPRARASRSRATPSLAEVAPSVGFTPREGLVLHQIAYDRGAPADMYRASFAEMSCPTATRAHARLQERVRHRRVRPRPARERARARLRLPRRDPLPRRVVND